jgi:transcriptional regulator with XRE-family HTH domain
MQDLGRQLRRMREFLGLTQQELAQRAGVSQGAVSRFEGGRVLSTPFVAIVRLNVALARAIAALDASMLSDDARRYLHYMRFLATPPEAARTGHRRQRVRSRPTLRAKN